MTPKLEVSALSYSYHTLDGETQALYDITFSVNSGEFVAIVGPSGCGKSTLLSIICGLLSPEKGQVKLDGIPISGSSPAIGYMLQKDHLFEWRSIFSNASLGLEIQHKLTTENVQKVHHLLETYGLTQFEQSRPSELSGGMRQRAALIRTLALEPDLLLLDEPFSALDYQTRLTVCDDIGMILRKSKKTALLITHDLAEAVSIADRIIILTRRPGRIKSILPIHFSTPNLSPLERRNDPAFSTYFKSVWKLLKS